MTGTWVIGMALNGVIGVAFITVGVILAARLTSQRSWRENPLASAFTLVAITCGVGHLGRSLLLAGPSLGVLELAGMASRVEFSDWHMWVADGVTAFAGVYYLTARFRHPEILWTSKVFNDLRERRRQAMLVHDGIVQDLAEARFSMAMGRAEQAVEALKRARITGPLGPPAERSGGQAHSPRNKLRDGGGGG